MCCFSTVSFSHVALKTFSTVKIFALIIITTVPRLLFAVYLLTRDECKHTRYVVFCFYGVKLYIWLLVSNYDCAVADK